MTRFRLPLSALAVLAAAPFTASPVAAQPAPRYPAPAYPAPGYPPPGYAAPGYPPPGYPAPGPTSVPGPGLNPPPAPPGVVYKRPDNVVGTGQSLPLSNSASNINGANTRSVIAPRLPPPPIPEGAPPAAFLQAARAALAAGRTGEAQESLERAETRTLDRSVPYSGTGQPSGQPLVQQISSALQALSTGNIGRTMQMIDAALANPEAAAL